MILFLLACARCDDGTLEIGGGDLAWTPMGETAPIVRGPQGGIHVFGSLRTDALTQGTDALDDPDNPILDFQVFDGDALLAGYSGLRRHFIVMNGIIELVGERLIFATSDPAEVDGRDVTISAHLVDVCGQERTAEVETTLEAAEDTGG